MSTIFRSHSLGIHSPIHTFASSVCPLYILFRWVDSCCCFKSKLLETIMYRIYFQTERKISGTIDMMQKTFFPFFFRWKNWILKRCFFKWKRKPPDFSFKLWFALIFRWIWIEDKEWICMRPGRINSNYIGIESRFDIFIFETTAKLD